MPILNNDYELAELSKLGKLAVLSARLLDLLEQIEKRAGYEAEDAVFGSVNSAIGGYKGIVALARKRFDIAEELGIKLPREKNYDQT